MIPKFQHYINTTEVMNIGGKPIYVEDCMKATAIGKLNTFLVGERGEGKTQITKDMRALFGNKGLFILGRNDLKLKELFQRLCYGKYKRGEIEYLDEIAELAPAIDYNIFVVDELTNMIPEVATQAFNLFDGFIELQGVEYKLGAGYTVGVATGNIIGEGVGNGRYLGASELNAALKDRMHLILDVDNFPTRPRDTLEIIANRTDPRVQDAKPEDSVELIKKLHNSLDYKKLPLITYLATLHLVHGLDYIDLGGQAGNSKRRIKNVWPNVPNSSPLAGGDELVIFPISKRSAISYLILTMALGKIAEMKGAKDIDYLNLFFDTFKLAGAYSGILNPTKVRTDYYGNAYLCLDAVVQGIQNEFNKKKEEIGEIVSLAQYGAKDEELLKEFKGKFGYIKDIANYFAETKLGEEEIKESIATNLEETQEVPDKAKPLELKAVGI